MTTKRKQILKAIAVSGSATIDDLVMTTGLERKNLHDNVKATLKDELCQRIKDDVTDGWLRLAKEFECNNIPELRVFINAAVDKLDRLRSAKTDSLKNAHPEPAYSTDDAKPRYIVAENYMTASSEDQANAIALEIAKNIEIDTPVVVFSAHKARELRINWRDA